MLAPLDEIAQAIDAHDSFLIAAHVGPDGDAIGSGLALQQAIRACGKEAWTISTDSVPVSCRFLPDWQSVSSAPPRQPQCAIIIDCDGSRDRVAAPYHFVQNAKFRVLIDHHRTSKPIFDVNWLDIAMPATAQMIYELLKHLQTPLTPEIAQCLLCGLSTDTGNFRFSNTTPACLRAAADLVESGADPAQIALKLFDERSLEATKLLAIALNKMQVDCDGELMWTTLTTQDFQSVLVGDESSENVVNILRNVRGARLAIVMRERADETGPITRVSVRADPQLRADLFCAQFGGGGHAAAAGCRVRYRPFEESVKLIISNARHWLSEEHPVIEE
ncbi:MAG: bifunctional oligoribonuclease and phosphatase NrnA [Abditibacteriota bacterium]|jgi:phosphoesterase RecJ-like protein|nr:bifunctional oligoribonuclease and phosphatase NrnA [Abditibacteriota bacterium]